MNNIKITLEIDGITPFHMTVSGELMLDDPDRAIKKVGSAMKEMSAKAEKLPIYE